MGRQFCFTLAFLIVITATCSLAQTSVEYTTIQTVRIASPAFKPSADIEGSPYVPGDSMQTGWLVNGTKRVPLKLHYNSYTGEIEYTQDNQIVTPASTINEFVILGADTLHFRKGFPTTATRSANDFYQILFDGRKTKLVRYIFSAIKSNTDAMANDFGKKKFQKREEYYVWIANGQPPVENYFLKLSEGEMKSVVASKKSLISLFPRSAEQIDRYVTEQRIKFKSWAEFASVLKYLDAQ